VNIKKTYYTNYLWKYGGTETLTSDREYTRFGKQFGIFFGNEMELTHSILISFPKEMHVSTKTCT
jgi:hypothetical protein